MDYLDDEELEQWYELAASEDWDCLPYSDATKKQDNTE